MKERTMTATPATATPTEFQIGEEIIWNGDPLMPGTRAVVDEIKGGCYYLTIINPDGSTGFRMVEPHETRHMEKSDFLDVQAKRIARRIHNTTYDHSQHVKYEETVLANATAAYIKEQWTLAARLGITDQVQALVDSELY